MNSNYQVGSVVFGNWVIKQKIGEGSFGQVFEAQREDFGHTYKAAVKIITIPQTESEFESVRADGLDDESITSYFRGIVEELVEEFALMSDLKGHSNIVSYEDHTVVPHTDGIGWDIMIRMELLTPLIQYVRTNAMTQRDIIQLGIDLCKALELCQKYKIIHRDIKPENIFISPVGDFKLGDFGIARTAEKTTSGMSKKGTYTYMAPEIYRDQPYGATVDIYSLGIVLYWLLNENRSPFLPAYPAAITHSDRERALCSRMDGEEIPAPKNADGRLAEIVLKACAYDPKERYSSPVQMRRELEAILYNQRELNVIFPSGEDLPTRSVHEISTNEAVDVTESAFSPKRPERQAPAETEEENKTESAFSPRHTEQSSEGEECDENAHPVFDRITRIAFVLFTLIIIALSVIIFLLPEQERQASAHRIPSDIQKMEATDCVVLWLDTKGKVWSTDIRTNELIHEWDGAVDIAAAQNDYFALLNDGTVWSCDTESGDVQCIGGLNDITSISADHGCCFAVDQMGQLWCYMRFSSDEKIVTQITDVEQVKQATGDLFTGVILKMDGSVWVFSRESSVDKGVCWGEPIQMVGLENIVAVDIFRDTVIALDKENMLWTCDIPRLADEDVSFESALEYENTPTAIFDNVSSFSTNRNVCVVLKNDGSVWTFDFDYPQKVEGLDDVALVATGLYEGIYAIDRNDELWAWDLDPFASLGSTPVHIFDEIACPIKATELSAVVSELSAARYPSKWNLDELVIPITIERTDDPDVFQMELMRASDLEVETWLVDSINGLSPHYYTDVWSTYEPNGFWHPEYNVETGACRLVDARLADDCLGTVLVSGDFYQLGDPIWCAYSTHGNDQTVYIVEGPDGDKTIYTGVLNVQSYEGDSEGKTYHFGQALQCGDGFDEYAQCVYLY